MEGLGLRLQPRHKVMLILGYLGRFQRFIGIKGPTLLKVRVPCHVSFYYKVGLGAL